ncbi:MAG: hypothetical protein ACNA71_02240 [Kiritimatiellia bacterium]
MHEEVSIWGGQKLVANAVSRYRVGPLCIWLERRGDELHYAFSRKDIDVPLNDVEKPDHIEWSRWICGEGDLDLELKPSLPPRPVVVRPVMPLTILPGQTVRFFVSIPVYVAGILVDTQSGKSVTAFEEPTVILSNSWFGQPVDGTLCYALRTRARRAIEELRTDAHFAICPMELRNMSDGALFFDRLLLRTSRLGVYRGSQHLWTSVATLAYHGEMPLPELQYAAEVPGYDGAKSLFAAPREQIKRGMMDRAWEGIRGIGKVQHV